MPRAPRPPQPFRVISTTSLDSRRISFEPDSLLVETRDLVGSYQPSDEVFWDEVRAVYTWSAPNWNTFGGLALVILLLGGLAVTLLAMAGGSVWIVGAVALLVLAAAALLVIRLPPRQWYRVESTRMPVEFATRRQDTLEHLLSHLTVEDGSGTPGGGTRPDAPFAS